MCVGGGGGGGGGGGVWYPAFDCLENPSLTAIQQRETSAIYLLRSRPLRVGLLAGAWLVITEGLVMWSLLDTPGADTWRRITGLTILAPPPGANIQEMYS